MKKCIIMMALIVASYSLAVAQAPTTFGVGINTPVGTLHVHSAEGIPQGLDPIIDPGPFTGDTNGPRFLTYDYNTILHLTNTNTGTSANRGFSIDQYNKDVVIRQYEQGSLTIQNNESRIILTRLGNVGVGAVANGGENFYVQGTARITNSLRIGNGFYCDNAGNLKVKNLRVTLTDWADFVFADSYRTMPLAQLERYIAEHRHLPGVPSAAEVEQEGVDVGEMNKMLLQKVEELTLYIIDLQKQIDNLKTNK